MKDMSVEELLDIMSEVYVTANLLIEAKAELLRRFEALGKENKELKQRDEVWREKKSLLENDLGKAWIEINNLKCCGNCGAETRDCVYWKSEVGCNGYCSRWQTDGLNRGERDGK